MLNLMILKRVRTRLGNATLRGWIKGILLFLRTYAAQCLLLDICHYSNISYSKALVPMFKQCDMSSSKFSNLFTQFCFFEQWKRRLWRCDSMKIRKSLILFSGVNYLLLLKSPLKAYNSCYPALRYWPLTTTVLVTCSIPQLQSSLEKVGYNHSMNTSKIIMIANIPISLLMPVPVIGMHSVSNSFLHWWGCSCLKGDLTHLGPRVNCAFNCYKTLAPPFGYY